MLSCTSSLTSSIESCPLMLGCQNLAGHAPVFHRRVSVRKLTLKIFRRDPGQQVLRRKEVAPSSTRSIVRLGSFACGRPSLRRAGSSPVVRSRDDVGAVAGVSLGKLVGLLSNGSVTGTMWTTGFTASIKGGRR